MLSNRKTVAVRGVGDFANRIQTVFVDLNWLEPANEYEQTKSQALSGASPFSDRGRLLPPRG